jgi:hypothetical protein
MPDTSLPCFVRRPDALIAVRSRGRASQLIAANHYGALPPIMFPDPELIGDPELNT